MRLHDYLEYWARVRPDAPFSEFEGRTLTYAEADALANRIANGLIASGLQAGDRFAVLSKNSDLFVILYCAASKAGVVPVPLNYRLAPPEWSYIVKDSGARLLIARGELAAGVEGVRGELSDVGRWIAQDSEVAGWDAWNDFLGDDTAPSRSVDEGMDLYQMYTSGTTGHPKGAVIPQSAMCANVHQVGTALAARAGDRALIVAPLYHAAACIVAFSTLAAGGSLVVQEDFAPGPVVDALSGEDIAIALLVPAMIQFCLVGVPDVADRDFSKLRTVVYGASAISEEVLRNATQVFGCDFVQGYGMTETSAVASMLLPEDHERALSGEKPELLLSAGRPLLGTEIRLVDADDRVVPAGEIGEIKVRGPQLMRGYWNLPEATASALVDGWMHTGDAGRLDDEGFLYIQDRVKDMIVSGGENVYPREIEEVLFKHPAVADAAVIGVPDDQWGEVLKAIVVRKEGEGVDADEIIDFCRERLASYKRPRSVDFIDELPRNPSGKVLKRELREPYWAGKQRRVN
jgi:acyl-CoA synthetase (AMP-forming)/AMP-acid ligase II